MNANRRPKSYNHATGRFEYTSDPAPSKRRAASDPTPLFLAFEMTEAGDRAFDAARREQAYPNGYDPQD